MIPTLLDVLQQIRMAVTGDDGEPIITLAEPLGEGGIEYQGRRYDVAEVLDWELLGALDAHIEALEAEQAVAR